VKPVDLAPLPAALAKVPKARVVLLNALRGPRPGGALAAAAKLEQVFFDLATLETTGGVATALEHIPPERLLFGTHAPFFYPESAVLKMRESPLQPEVATKVLAENARRLLGPEL
jgi:predicted TIM-barrel fold metal-dependent hydrolase